MIVIALELPSSVAAEIIQLSKEVSFTEFSLNGKALPHITLFLGTLDDKHMQELKKRIQECEKSPVLCEPKQIYIKEGKRHTGEKAIYVGIDLYRNREIIQMRKSILEALRNLPMKEYAWSNSYQPHITLARCTKRPKKPLLRINPFHASKISIFKVQERGGVHHRIKSYAF